MSSTVVAVKPREAKSSSAARNSRLRMSALRRSRRPTRVRAGGARSFTVVGLAIMAGSFNLIGDLRSYMTLSHAIRSCQAVRASLIPDEKGVGGLSARFNQLDHRPAREEL